MGACPVHSLFEGLGMKAIAPICFLTLFVLGRSYGFLPSDSTAWYFLWNALLLQNASWVLLRPKGRYFFAQNFTVRLALLMILTTIFKIIFPLIHPGFQNGSYMLCFLALASVNILTNAIPWYIQLRKYIYTETYGANFTGRLRPAFYFGVTDHVRFTPVFHKFKYPLMYFGFPVEFEGTVNALVSVRGVNQGPEKAHWGKGHQLWTFFEADPTRYFNPHLPFSQKLDPVFEANDIDKSLYDIFFVTTPSFLGYCFNPVSYWYLYSKATGELQIVVLEVNNTFGEKHVYVIRHDNPRNPKTRQGFAWCGVLDKRFHISPFNHRSGTYQIHVGDPLNQELLYNIHMVVFHRDGSKIMTAGVRSTQPGLDIVNASLYNLFYTIAAWGFNQWLAIPRTMFEAWKTFKKGALVYTRPEVLKGSGGRNPSEGEKEMIAMWLKYFEDRVQKYPQPLTVSIVMPQPHASSVPEIITIQNVTEPSPLTASKDGSTTPQNLELSIQVNNPRFFRRFFALQDPAQAIYLDIESQPYERHSAYINNMDLFRDVLLKSRPSEIGEYFGLRPQHSLRWRVLSIYRRLFSAKVMTARALEMVVEAQCTEKEDKSQEENSDPPSPQYPTRFNTLDYYISSQGFFTISKYRSLSLEAYLVDTVASGDVESFQYLINTWKGFVYFARVLVIIWLGVSFGGRLDSGKVLAEGEHWSKITTAVLFGIVNIGWVFETVIGYF